MKRTGIHLLAAVLLLVTTGCEDPRPRRYGAEPFSATVVDAATGEPLAGATVTVAYPLQKVMHRSLEGISYGYVRDLALFETRTNTNGRFEVPAVAMTRAGIGERLPREAPLIGLFKPGYVFEVKRNTFRYTSARTMHASGTVRSDHDETVIALTPRAAGDVLTEDELRRIEWFREPWTLQAPRCRWTRTPALTAALLDVRDAPGLNERLRSRLPDIARLHAGGDCPDPAVALAEWRDSAHLPAPAFTWQAAPSLTLAVGRRTPNLEFIETPAAPAGGDATVMSMSPLVPPGTLIIVENARTGEAVEQRTDGDGGFEIAMRVAKGDRLRVAMVDFAQLMQAAPQPALQPEPAPVNQPPDVN